MKNAILATRLEPLLASVIEEWDRLTPAVRKRTTIDQICEIKGIDATHFLAVVAEAASKFAGNASILIAAMNMPSVVQQCVRQALKPEGDKDRKMLFQHSGFVPTPEGTRINILNRNALKAEVNTEAARGLPSFENSMAALEDE